MAAKNNDIEGAVAGELEEFDPASLLGRGRGARRRGVETPEEEEASPAQAEQEPRRESRLARSRKGARKKATAKKDKAARAKAAPERGKKRRRVYVGEIIIGETD